MTLHPTHSGYPSQLFSNVLIGSEKKWIRNPESWLLAPIGILGHNYLCPQNTSNWIGSENAFILLISKILCRILVSKSRHNGWRGESPTALLRFATKPDVQIPFKDHWRGVQLAQRLKPSLGVFASQIRVPGFKASFASNLAHLSEAALDSRRTWVPATHAGHPDWVASFRLCHGPAQAVPNIWEVAQQRKISLNVFLHLK